MVLVGNNPHYANVTFCHKEPTSEDFMVTNSGAFILKRSLNYNTVQKYDFIVTAKVTEHIHTCSSNSEAWIADGCASSLQDNGGLNDSASVLITVEDFDNLNPYFSHNVYQAFIPENQVSLWGSTLSTPKAYSVLWYIVLFMEP